MRVLVVGPDGTGKTTLLDAVEQKLANRGLSVRRIHFDPEAVQDRTRVVQNPQAQSPRSPVGQAASVVARAVHYLRSRGRVGGLLRPNVNVLFQERGWYDQIVDPARYRMSVGLALRLVRLLGPLISPRYHAVVLCTGDPRIVHARKPELEPAEINRQIQAWRFSPATRGAIEVDTTMLSSDQAAVTVLEYIDAVRASSIVRNLARVVPAPGRLELRAMSGARSSASSLYRPARSWAQVSKRFMRRLPLWRDVRTNDPLDVLVRILCRDGELGFDRLAAIRSHGRERIVVSLEKDNGLVAFAKYSWGANVGSLRHELEGMRRAGQLEGFALPEVIRYIREPDVEILILRPCDHPDASADVSTVTAAAVALARCADGKGITHGDLAPWNILASKPPVILDWEMWEPNFRPYADIGYCLAEMVRLGQVSLSAAIAALREYADCCALPPPHPMEVPKVLRPAIDLWEVKGP